MSFSSSGIDFCQCFLGFIKRSHGYDGGTAASCPDAAPQTQDPPVIEQILHYPDLVVATALGIFPAGLLPVVETRIEHGGPLKADGVLSRQGGKLQGYDGVHGGCRL